LETPLSGARLETSHEKTVAGETLYWRRRCQALPCHGFRLDNASSTDRCTLWNSLDAGSDGGRRIILSGVAAFGGDLRLM